MVRGESVGRSSVRGVVSDRVGSDAQLALMLDIPGRILRKRLKRFRMAIPFRVAKECDILVHFGPCSLNRRKSSASSSGVQGASRTRSGDRTSRHRFATCSSVRPGTRNANFQLDVA
jgi:hypothetical protein